MSDFIREVDESYRQDLFRNFISRHWVSLLLFVVVVLAGAGGWRGYQYWHQQQAETAGARYIAATDLAVSDPKASIAALDAIGRDGPAGYRVLARFRAAGELGKTDTAGAIKAFDGVAADSAASSELRDIARLRAGILSVDTADPAELKRRLEPLADANSPYRSIAREMLAVAALKRGDDAVAKTWLDTMLADRSISTDNRQRATAYLSLIEPAKPASDAVAPLAPAPAPPAKLPATP